MKNLRIQFWLSVIGMLLTSAFWIFEIADVPPIFADWRLAALVCFLIYTALMWWQLWTYREEIFANIPNIEFVEWEINPNVEMRRTRPSPVTPSGQYSAIEYGTFCKVVFANNPKRRTSENTANNVSAKITFYDADEKLLIGPIYGRWSDSDEPKTSIDIPSLINANILSNGTPFKLDLFMKFPEDEFCYAYNNDSYFFENWRHVNYKLTAERFFIHIELIGERVEKDFWFSVYNKDRGKQLQITLRKNAS
jgi:hypothetical protein